MSETLFDPTVLWLAGATGAASTGGWIAAKVGRLRRERDDYRDWARRLQRDRHTLIRQRDRAVTGQARAQEERDQLIETCRVILANDSGADDPTVPRDRVLVVTEGAYRLLQAGAGMQTTNERLAAEVTAEQPALHLPSSPTREAGQ